MGKHVSPLLGYNNNVRHKNRVFHIQTEDSGVKHPHIITHLFMDGGRILKSVKRSYAEHVGADGMQDIVKQMMKEQHKAMFIALRDGQFDHLLEGQANTSQAPASKATQPKLSAHPSAAVASAVSAPPPAVTSPSKPVILSAPAPPVAPAIAVAARTDPMPPRPDDEEMVPMTTRTPELTLDIDALERAAASGGTAGGLRSQSDLPPPPANLFREKSAGGKYRSVPPPAPGAPGAAAQAAAAHAPAPVESKRAPSIAPKGPAPAPKGSPSADNRYAAARPAAIFGQSRPQTGSSIFGEDLISDKSLDEVILSYFAEDLEPIAEKNEKKK